MKSNIVLGSAAFLALCGLWAVGTAITISGQLKRSLR